MRLSWKDAIVNFSHLDNNSLTECWTWLVGASMTPILISIIGDMFLTNNEGQVYWLNVSEGKLELVAQNRQEFNNKLENEVVADEWFLFDLIHYFKQSGIELKEGKLYGYKQYPILGGDFVPENFEQTDIKVHFALAGQVYEQVRNLPEGTPVKLSIK